VKHSLIDEFVLPSNQLARYFGPSLTIPWLRLGRRQRALGRSRVEDHPNSTHFDVGLQFILFDCNCVPRPFVSCASRKYLPRNRLGCQRIQQPWILLTSFLVKHINHLANRWLSFLNLPFH